MNHTVRVHRTLAMLGLALVASCAPMPQAADPNTSAGYLTKEALPDSLTLLPPPPAAGSAALAHDEEVHASAQALRNTPRYQLAALDADMSFPQGAGAFACTLGIPIDAEHTPRLLKLLRRSLMDAGRSTGNAKNQYRRTRPFAAHEELTCTPQDEGILRNNGSYPSGHAAAGWTWALVLAEVDPSRAGAILARGRNFGESRLVCNVHWQSDILEGRFMAAAVVSQLHTVAEFREDVEAARRELAEVRAKGLPSGRDCTLEAQALKQKIPGVL